MRFEKTSLKPLLVQLSNNYPASLINPSEILSAYHDVLGNFDLSIANRAFAMAPSRHPRFFPNSGELYTLCRELYEKEREQAKQVAESMRLTKVARDADRSLTHEESKAMIAHILIMLEETADMNKRIKETDYQDDAYDFIEDKTGKWERSRQIAAGVFPLGGDI